MQQFNLAKHIYNSIYIVRTNTIIFWVLGLIGITSSINSLFPNSVLHIALVAVYIIAAVVATPVIYGIYFQIIEDNYSGVVSISKKYIGRYLLLLLRLYVPIALFFVIPMLSAPGGNATGSVHMLLISCSLLFIYIVPYFYVTDKQAGAIGGGIQFLLKNLIVSAPLVLVSLLTESILLLFQLNQHVLLEGNKLLFVAADLFLFLSANAIDFVLFITMVFVLKEHLQPSPEQNSNNEV